jgi:hypothetical protein
VLETGSAKKMWRLVTTKADGQLDGEVVFKVQGILVKAELVAPKSLDRYVPKRMLYFIKSIAVANSM